MKKSAILSVLTILLLLPFISAAKQSKSDPVVMTVGPETVHLSEFEYLYKKNNEQQVQSTTLDEYVDMFVNYKLKVLAAREAGMDTTAAFLSDLEQYRAELATPYMRDKAVDDSLLHVAYGHMLENVAVYHLIMSSRDKDGKPIAGNRATMDSLRNVILNGQDFDMVARRYTSDPNVKRTGTSYMGYIPAGVLPYAFEDMAYNTPVGELSPVFETQFGYHLIKVVARRPDPGQVKVRHILKITRGVSSSVEKHKREQIDSIYQVLKSGADFSEVATRETEDPSGRKNGGDLPWFGSGRMVPEFEKVAFALADGEMSEPIKSAFGYHIILREDHKDTPTFEDAKKGLEEKLMRDERRFIAEKRLTDKYRKQWKAKTEAKARKQVQTTLEFGGGYNEYTSAKLLAMSTKAVSVGPQSRTIGEVAKQMVVTDSTNIASVMASYDAAAEKALDSATQQVMLATLAQREPAYRNLINEYRDGILLYEISNKNVWDRANTDKEGLQACFEAHRADFTWDKPHYKGYVVAAVSDSVADAAVAYLTEVNPASDEMVTTLRKKFGTEAKVERVITGKGDNAIIDYIGFGAEKPETQGRWKAYRAYAGKVIDQPEEAVDIKGPVSMLYQQELEDAWLKDLHSRYKVVVNQKVLDTIK